MIAKSPRHGEYVTIKEPNGRALQAWVVYPEVKGKAPVVVMVHEIFGLTDWAREMADEVAAAGYIVVEPDMLSGFGPPMSATPPVSRLGPPGPITARDIERSSQVGTPMSAMSVPIGARCDPMDCAPGEMSLLQRVAAQQQAQPAAPGARPGDAMPPMHIQTPGAANTGAPYMAMSPGGTAAFPDQSAAIKAVSALDPALVLADLNAAADYGKRLPSASNKLYIAGFCWGGGKSFDFATHRKDLSAAFVFYGEAPAAAAMKNIAGPVYGFYAEKDSRITATIPQTATDMKAAGKTYEPITYDGAGHGFMRAGEAPDANAENAAARAAGFRRFIDLLGGVR